MRIIDAPDLSGHSFGQRTPDNPNGICPQCIGEHGGAGPCDAYQYSRAWVRFMLIPWHLEALVAAHYNPDKRAATNERARLMREFQTRPARHDCSCRCPWESAGRPACDDCRKLRANQKHQEAVEQGRGSHVVAPSPSAEMLDLIAGYLGKAA